MSFLDVKMDENFTRLANETVEALSRTNLSAYEWRFLMVVFRKTYGFQKKEDWIALSQIVEMSGMHKAHVSRSKKKLLDRNIVTQTGNKIAFNKYHTQWRELPKQVTSKIVTQTGNKVTYSGNLPPPIQVITPPPKQAYTKETLTKEILQKKEPIEKTTMNDERLSTEETKTRFHRLLVDNQWCDEPYAEKTWSQGKSLPAENRTEFYRKVNYMMGLSNSQRMLPKAKLMFHEISGYVNDTQMNFIANRPKPEEE